MKGQPCFPPSTTHRNKLLEFKISRTDSTIRLYAINTPNSIFFPNTLANTYISPPFCLFSEVACPLSKVCFAKGRVHFHIFPLDMRRLSIVLCFLFPASCLSQSTSLFAFSSCCSAHSHIPVPCLPGGVGGWGVGWGWGVPGRCDTNNYRATIRQWNTIAFVYVQGKCMRDECRCECRVVNNRGADGNTWSQLFPLPLCLIRLLTFNAKLLRQTRMCLLSVTSLLTHSFCLWHMHACSSHLLVYSCWIINFWAGWCDSNTHRDTHTLSLAHTHRRWLETGSIPLSVLLKEALTSSLALGQTHSYPSEKREGERKKEGEWARAGREKEGRCSGSQVTRWPAACVFSILLPLLPELWASCGPLGWSSHLSFSSSSSHLSCTSPSYGCRGSWSHSEAWWEQDKELVRRREGFTWAVDINILRRRNQLIIFWTLESVFEV